MRDVIVITNQTFDLIIVVAQVPIESRNASFENMIHLLDGRRQIQLSNLQ
jgi:hypothetical protein